MAEVCVACGEPTDDPVWAIYADESFRERDEKQDAFPLDDVHFAASEWIEAAWWENDPVTNEAVLRTERRLRYLRAPDAGRYSYEELSASG
jgi:hypothetical protein